MKLKFTNATDAGNFECQVSTNPKISQIFQLTVVGKELFDFSVTTFPILNLKIMFQFRQSPWKENKRSM